MASTEKPMSASERRGQKGAQSEGAGDGETEAMARGLTAQGQAGAGEQPEREAERV